LSSDVADAGLRRDPPSPRLRVDAATQDDPEAPGRHAHRPLGAVARGSSWVQDRLPPSVQGRVQLGASHLAVVALVVAAALAGTAWWVTRAGPAGTTVPAHPVVAAPSPGADAPPEATAAAGGPVGAAPTGSGPAGSGAAATGSGAAATGSGMVVVDVAGKVRRPGIVTLPTGSRVVDALREAGGPRPGAGTAGLNLARVLVDGEQVLVGLPAAAGPAAAAVGSPGGSPSGGPTGALVNINTGDQTALETLPGVGPVTAQAILAYRTENGPFTTVDELVEVSGIGDATLAEIAPHVTL
jgi:competence protein ComEA